MTESPEPSGTLADDSRQMQREYQICRRCIMDTSDPAILFDEDGVCNHCHKYNVLMARLPPTAEARRAHLETEITRIKERGRGRAYDCVIGLSGGVDSSYVAYLAKEEFGLRPLAVHCDIGWNSELAVQNIENIVKKLDIDLYTFVCDWDEVRDLQVAFIRSGINHADTPQDHAHYAATYQIAAKHKIRFILSGKNVATEGVLPVSWVSDVNDTRLLKAIHRRFGTGKLQNYPLRGTFTRYFYDRFVNPAKLFRPLDYVPFVKAEASELLSSELGWRAYSGKHHESVFTRFFQCCYLPTRFGFEKRRAHLASLILSGEITRDEAMERMQEDHYPAELARSDLMFVAKKLGMSEQELLEHIHAPPKLASDYPSHAWIINPSRTIYRKFQRVVRGSRAASL